MFETTQSRVTVTTGLDLHVEEIRRGDTPPATARPATGSSRAPSPPLVPQAPQASSVAADEVPVLLVHGIAGGAADWAEVVPDLAASRRVVAYDQRGHGASGRAPGGRMDYTFDWLLADLVAVVDSLGPGPVDLVGHSMGGVISLRFTLDFPGRVRSLLLVDTAAAPAGATSPVARRLVGVLLDGFAAVASARHNDEDNDEDNDDEANDDQDGYDTQTGGDVHPARADGSPAGTVDGRPGTGQRSVGDEDEPESISHTSSAAQRAATALGQTDPEAVAAFGRELGQYPSLMPRLCEIAVPTTVIVGEKDSLLRESAQSLAREIPGARLVVIADADHSPHASRPLAWLAAADSHFARAASSPVGSDAASDGTVPEQSLPEQPLRPPTQRLLQAATSGEREVLEAFIDFYRDVLIQKVRGVSDADGARRRLPSDTTLIGLVRHLGEVERNWFHRLTDPAVDENDPGPGWDLAEGDSVEQAIADYERICARSRATAASFTLDDVVIQPEMGEVTLRWIYVHMIEETARHTGHADILRELTDGSTGALG